MCAGMAPNCIPLTTNVDKIGKSCIFSYLRLEVHGTKEKGKLIMYVYTFLQIEFTSSDL